MKLLVKGWTSIPHSYAIVNCFQLVHLVKHYGDKLKIYVDEMPYYRKEWESKKKLVYGDEYNAIINSLEKWNGQKVDLVYSITYPYDITHPCVGDTPKIVFYTSEFAWLDNQFFMIDGRGGLKIGDIQDHIKQHSGLYFTAPSIWSANGLKEWGVDDDRNRVITHGVDPSIFKQLDENRRQKVREFYNVKEDDILLINIGAMTQNKGIMFVFAALNVLIKKGHRNVKLLLKGTSDLYSSKQFVETYMSSLKNDGVLTQSDVDTLLENHIIFVDKTMSYGTINDLFNAADMYVSPYLAEGFNLTVLESLTAGLPVLVPRTGSTREFINDIYIHGGEGYIHYLDTQVVKFGNGMMQNNYKLDTLVETLERFISSYNYTDRHTYYSQLRSWIVDNYSWKKVAGYLWDYFNKVVTDSNCQN